MHSRSLCLSLGVSLTRSRTRTSPRLRSQSSPAARANPAGLAARDRCVLHATRLPPPRLCLPDHWRLLALRAWQFRCDDPGPPPRAVAPSRGQQREAQRQQTQHASEASTCHRRRPQAYSATSLLARNTRFRSKPRRMKLLIEACELTASARCCSQPGHALRARMRQCDPVSSPMFLPSTRVRPIPACVVEQYLIRTTSTHHTIVDISSRNAPGCG